MCVAVMPPLLLYPSLGSSILGDITEMANWESTPTQTITHLLKYAWRILLLNRHVVFYRHFCIHVHACSVGL